MPHYLRSVTMLIFYFSTFNRTFKSLVTITQVHNDMKIKAKCTLILFAKISACIKCGTLIYFKMKFLLVNLTSWRLVLSMKNNALKYILKSCCQQLTLWQSRVNRIYSAYSGYILNPSFVQNIRSLDPNVVINAMLKLLILNPKLSKCWRNI